MEARTDRRTDVTKLIIALRNSTTAPNKAQNYQSPIPVAMLSLDVQLCPVLLFRFCCQAITADCYNPYTVRTDGTYRLMHKAITDMRRLTTGIRSEKCVVRRFRRCANVIQCTYPNPDSTV